MLLLTVTVAANAVPADAQAPPHWTPVLGAVGAAVTVTLVPDAKAPLQLTGDVAFSMLQTTPVGVLVTPP